MGDTGATTTPIESVDYSQQAVDNVNQIIGKVDFDVFMIMFVAVIGATIGVTVGITALKKGVAWLKAAIADRNDFILEGKRQEYFDKYGKMPKW